MPLNTSRLRSPLSGLATGAILGAFAGILLDELGLGGLLPPTIWIPAPLVGGILAGSLIGAIGRRHLLWYVDAALLVFYLLVGHTPVIAQLSKAWVRQDQPPPAAGAVAVLSSSVQTDTALDQFGLDRLLTGMELASQGRAPRIVTSRVDRALPSGHLTTDADQRRIIRMIDSTVQWSVVDSVYSTRDEAVRMARLLLPAGVRSIYLVTSPMHTRRACATFEAVGFTVACQPALEHGHPVWRPETAQDRLASFRQYIYERLGMLKYRSKGWAR